MCQSSLADLRLADDEAARFGWGYRWFADPTGAFDPYRSRRVRVVHPMRGTTTETIPQGARTAAGLGYRLVVLDLDGTVLRISGRVSRLTRAALRAARAHGATVVVATGRAPAGAQQFAKILGARGPLICLDGALAFDGGVMLCDRPLAHSDAEAAAALACQCGGGWIALTREGRVHGGPSRRPPQATLSRVLRHPLRSWRFYRTVRREPACRSEHVPDEPVYKLLLWAPAGEARARLVQQVHLLPVRVPSGPGTTIEVVGRGVDKGSALAAVVRHMGLTADDVVAFGDGFNDIEMLAFAGHGVAMGGAPPQVVAASSAQTDSVERDGVARELQRLLGDQVQDRPLRPRT